MVMCFFPWLCKLLGAVVCKTGRRGSDSLMAQFPVEPAFILSYSASPKWDSHRLSGWNVVQFIVLKDSPGFCPSPLHFTGVWCTLRCGTVPTTATARRKPVAFWELLRQAGKDCSVEGGITLWSFLKATPGQDRHCCFILFFWLRRSLGLGARACRL